MFRFVAEILVRAKIKRENLKRKRAFLSWQEIEKIALLIEEEDAPNKSEIDKFIADTKKYIEVFYIQLKSKTPAYADWNCLIKKDRTFLGLPKTETEYIMKEKTFDLVINTCSPGNLFAISLSSSNSAPFHCSSDNLYNDADVIVKRLEQQKLLNYLNNTLIYLRMIKTN